MENFTKLQDLAGKKNGELQLKELKDPKNIAFAVGLCDWIFRSFLLPSTVASRYETLKQTFRSG